MNITQRISNLIGRIKVLIAYCASGVWSDTRTGWRVNIVKTLNLSVRSFLSKDVQTAACGMAFRTLLAIIPALALLFAIGRGFGFLPVIQNALLNAFPAQKTAISQSFVFVDSYLNQSSEGVFLGVGIIVLLWTLISLVSNVESSFNKIWGVRQGRTIWRQVTDYTAMFMIIPVLMIASTGISVFMSSFLQKLFPFDFVTPLTATLLDISAWILTWLTFTAIYMLVPNTKVKFTNALIAGVLAGTAFELLQWVFISGQIYVSQYNAIYGSVAFLPLLMIWMQLVWVITLAGAVICFSSQNIFRYSFSNQLADVSPDYRTKVILAVAAIIARDYVDHATPRDENAIATAYKLPLSLVADITDQLIRAGIIYRTILNERKQITGFVPAIDTNSLTAGLIIRRLQNLGTANFIPDFATEFATVIDTVNRCTGVAYDELDNILITNLNIKNQ